jgi:hypothetical protein
MAGGGPDRVYMMRARGTWEREGVGEEELLMELDGTTVLERAAWCGEAA